MGCRLFKSEPDEYSIGDLRRERERIGRWDGIRNYQARNFLRDAVRTGERVLVRQGRLSIQPVTAIEWKTILVLGGENP